MIAFLAWIRKEYRYLARFLPTSAPTRNPPTGYASLYADSQGALKVRLSDGTIVSVSGGGGGTSDHTALSNLAWASSAHTGTASRLAAFDAQGAASYVQVGAAGGVQAYDADLDGYAALTTTGIVARTGAGTAATRTIAAGSGQIIVANGDGVSGSPTVDLAYASALRTSSGPTTMTVGAVLDGQYLRRSGSTVIGAYLALALVLSDGGWDALEDAVIVPVQNPVLVVAGAPV
jgi:hypothetical protein